jgi:hypothetical protein
VAAFGRCPIGIGRGRERPAMDGRAGRSAEADVCAMDGNRAQSKHARIVMTQKWR